MDAILRNQIIDGIKTGSVIPCLGPEVLSDVVSMDQAAKMPATSDELIIAMNGGRPMAPKLMYEFSRAAMNVELKRGRNAVTRFLTTTYGETTWTRSSTHDQLKALKPHYTIDINRDTQLLESHSTEPHYLVVGCARIGGSSYRFRLYRHSGNSLTDTQNGCYQEIPPEEATEKLPILFKPLGCPQPTPNYIASDADYVDYITELMGGFGVPAFIKEFRIEKQYALIGMRLNRDTERMVMSDLMFGSASHSGWAFIEHPTRKEINFCEKHRLELVREPWHQLFN